MVNFRLLDKTDYSKGYVDLLKQLTLVGEMAEEEYSTTFDLITKNKFHKIFVLENNNKIIATGTLLIEPKFIHKCSFVGHIEDIIVDKEYRGKGIGKELIIFLTNYAEKEFNCYKIILDCYEENVNFYEKCDYKKTGAYMSKYIKKN